MAIEFSLSTASVDLEKHTQIRDLAPSCCYNISFFKKILQYYITVLTLRNPSIFPPKLSRRRIISNPQFAQQDGGPPAGCQDARRALQVP
jgi:hypothetical protein